MSGIVANWAWPQWVLLALMVLTLIGVTSKHGTRRPDYNGFFGIIDFALVLFILVCGGFFS